MGDGQLLPWLMVRYPAPRVALGTQSAMAQTFQAASLKSDVVGLSV